LNRTRLFRVEPARHSRFTTRQGTSHLSIIVVPTQLRWNSLRSSSSARPNGQRSSSQARRDFSDGQVACPLPGLYIGNTRQEPLLT
jgi:hypothetical protein